VIHNSDKTDAHNRSTEKKIGTHLWNQGTCEMAKYDLDRTRRSEKN